MSEQNICSQCGGQKTVYYEPDYINGSAVMPARITIPGNICMCPTPTQKHGGDLGHNASVCYQDTRYDSGDVEEVLISDKIRHVWLTPEEALSLYRWLEQEKPHLEEIAKEQEL